MPGKKQNQESSRPGESSKTSPELTSPAQAWQRLERLAGLREEKQRRYQLISGEIESIEQFLEIADGVTDALELLSQQLFRDDLDGLQAKMSLALQDVLQQPVQFKATADFKRGSAIVEFSMERNGNEEDIRRGQGGSVHNILSVGLRLFALATLDQKRHRKFLVLDEQDCWLRPELVPKLVRIVQESAKELGFQVLMISHHDLSLFSQYADRIYRIEPEGNTVRVVEHKLAAVESDS